MENNTPPLLVVPVDGDHSDLGDILIRHPKPANYFSSEFVKKRNIDFDCLCQ